MIICLVLVAIVVGSQQFTQVKNQNDTNEPISPQQKSLKENIIEEKNQHKPVKESKRSKRSFFTHQKELDPLAILLLGVEKSKYEKHGRSDSIMLALVQPKSKQLMLVSIPRDTYIHIPNHGYDKLNRSFQLGGAELTKETITQWLDLKINHTASIDYGNFEKMVDLIGGIEMNVDRSMSHGNVSIEEGQQKLSGSEALLFVRFRKSGDGKHDSDYKRTERQRQLLSNLTSELVKNRSILQSFQLLHSLIKTVETTLPLQQIISYGHHYSDFSSENIITLSFKGTGDKRNGLWYEILSEDEIREKRDLINNFLEGKEIEVENNDLPSQATSYTPPLILMNHKTKQRVHFMLK